MNQATVPDFRKLLREGYQATGLSVSELWFRYRSAGGSKGQPAVKSWVSAKNSTLPDVDQYVILSKVINDRLRELGNHQLPDVSQMSYLLGVAA
jgi:hypothetical protein